jgi:hypothetical protein
MDLDAMHVMYSKPEYNMAKLVLARIVTIAQFLSSQRPPASTCATNHVQLTAILIDEN